MENTLVLNAQVQLGHSDLGTTSRYLAHIAPRKLIEQMQKAGISLQPDDSARWPNIETRSWLLIRQQLA